MLFDQTQIAELDRILESPEGQQLVQSLQTEEAALMLVESEKSRLAAQEKAIKSRMGKLFLGRGA